MEWCRVEQGRCGEDVVQVVRNMAGAGLGSVCMEQVERLGYLQGACGLDLFGLERV